jgi:fructokinase
MRVISVGEILWDLIEGNEFLGGAPLNLCSHLRQLGHQAFFISAVGDDERGRRALLQSAALGVDTRYVSITRRAATGISKVVLDQDGRATHHLPRPAAYDFVALNPEQRASLSRERPDWICFGTLAQMEAGPRTVTRLLLEDNPEAKRFYDVNLRPRCWTPELVEELLHQANAAKLNEDEADAIAALFGWPADSLAAFSELTARRFSLDLVCVTRGAEGCCLWKNGEHVESRGFPVKIADTVGAGDAFSAALLHGLAQKWNLARVAEFANRVGALVASRSGATPVWTENDALAIAGSAS